MMRTALGRPVAVVLTVIGGVLIPLAGYGLVREPGRDRTVSPAPLPAVKEQTGALDVTVRRSVYQPGQSSGWHSHAGIHAVIVMSGALTVYDSSCRPRSYGVDEPYVGGLENHLARNETGVPVEMTVVYMRGHRPAADAEMRTEPPAAGCPV